MTEHKIPSQARRCGLSEAISVPSSLIDLRSGGLTPVMLRRSVLAGSVPPEHGKEFAIGDLQWNAVKDVAGA